MVTFEEAARVWTVRPKSYVDIEVWQAAALTRGMREQPDLFPICRIDDGTLRMKAFVPEPDGTGLGFAVYGSASGDPAWCITAWYASQQISHVGQAMAPASVKRTVRALIEEITRRQNEKQGSLFGTDAGGF